MKHRDSQRRIYDKGLVYFITTNTEFRFPYFKIDMLCKILKCTMVMGVKWRQYRLIAYSILPDHLHLLVQPFGIFNISQAMHYIKRHSSRNINKIIDGSGEDMYPRLRFDIPRFKWQGSFHDHIIRDEDDFNNHIEYIYINPVKHGIVDEPECYRWVGIYPYGDVERDRRYDSMVMLVERMMDLKREYHSVGDENRRRQLGHEINANDDAIDNLVYRLYGLTEEEIRLVEGGIN